MAQQHRKNKVQILLLNPNSSSDMTYGMEEAIRGLGLPDSIEIAYYTAPAGSPPSINDGSDLDRSTSEVISHFDSHPEVFSGYDAILVACFSVHPLVAKLNERLRSDGVLVTGIFEASILTSFSLLPPYALGDQPVQTWGIVTTGKFWEDHLADGARKFLGQTDGAVKSDKFAGVYSTGLNAGDFHGDIPQEVIRQKLKDATKQLFSGNANVRCVVMGCAGMAGLEAIIRESAREHYGEKEGNKVAIVDGVKAGVGILDQAVRNLQAFQT